MTNILQEITISFSETAGVYQLLKCARGERAWPKAHVQQRGLQVLAQPLYLLNEEVDVRLGGGWVRDDHPEEVGFVPLRLVANHGCPRLHHQGFDLGSHPVQFFSSLRAVRNPSEALWNVPETDICVLRFIILWWWGQLKEVCSFSFSITSTVPASR